MSHHCQRACALLLVVVLLTATCLPSLAAQAAPAHVLTDTTTQIAAADDAVTWLVTQLQDDGSFPTTLGHPAGITLDALLAGVAANQDLNAWRNAPELADPLAYLAANAVDYAATGAAAAGKLAVGVVAAQADPWNLGGLNLETALNAFYDSATGVYAGLLDDQAWAMLGWAAMRLPAQPLAIATLKAAQSTDGGWGRAAGEASDSSTTAIALQALLAAGVPNSDAVIMAGLAYLRTVQDATGGFAYQAGSSADPNATSYCLQALIAAGQDPTAEVWQVNGMGARDALLAMQREDGGFAGSLGTADVLATAQAVPALVGRALPMPGVVPALKSALSWLKAQQAADGSVDGYNSARALMSLVAAGVDGRTWVSANGFSLVDAVERSAPFQGTVGKTGRSAAALAMAGENPLLADATNLVTVVEQSYASDTGCYDPDGYVYNHVLAVWTLYAAGVEVPSEAMTWLAAQRNDDGGWPWGQGFGSDSNSTALALETLLALGYQPSDDIVVEALAYLKGIQSPDGGFPYDPTYGSAADGNSTALVLQAMYAAGVEPTVGWEWASAPAEGIGALTVLDPLDRLLAMQMANGAFQWMPGYGENSLATIEALPALVGVAFPLANSVLPTLKQDVDWLRAQQQTDGSFAAFSGSPVDVSLDVLLAGVAAGSQAGQWSVAEGQPTVLGYLDAETDEIAATAEGAGKLAVGLVAAGENPLDFGGMNLKQLLLGMCDKDSGFGIGTPAQAWAILGLAAMKTPAPSAAVRLLADARHADGGWGRLPGDASDAVSTAFALQALRAAHLDAQHPAIQDGLAYLRAVQDAATMGFGMNAGAAPDASTTALCIQALAACGEPLRGQPWGSMSGANPVQALHAMRLAGGAYPGSAGTADLLTTAQALPGLLIEPLPFFERHFDGLHLALVRK